MLRWCERHGVDYIVGLAKNSRLLALVGESMQSAERQFESTQEKQRHFGSLDYAADTWDRERRVIAKAEHSAQGANPRFVVTSLAGDAQALYDEVYCARGEMENRIKEQQLGLFADRTSGHGWGANQFRLLLSSAAYVLMETIRRVGLCGSELARAQVTTIRLKVLKLGTVILRNCPRRGPAVSAPRFGVGAAARGSPAAAGCFFPAPTLIRNSSPRCWASSARPEAGPVLSPAPEKTTGVRGRVSRSLKNRHRNQSAGPFTLLLT